MQHHASRAGLTMMTKAGPVWNGEVRFNEQWIDQPLTWKRPRMIFVCAHGDLFHEAVPDEWIDKVFAVMALADQHIFQVLTKRSARMRAYMSCAANRIYKKSREGYPNISISTRKTLHSRTVIGGSPVWPLPNVWLGVSAERQQEADERMPDLLATPAAVRFASAEPLLGPLDLSNYFVWTARSNWDAYLDWVIAGGESGPRARPMHLNWAMSLRDQCAAARVPFFFKQWGEWAPLGQHPGHPDWMIIGRAGDLDIPDDRWPDEATGEAAVVRVGKKSAGRLLDGVEYNGMPR